MSKFTKLIDGICGYEGCGKQINQGHYMCQECATGTFKEEMEQKKREKLSSMQ